MGQTKALATQSKNVAVQSVLDDVSIDPRLAMAAKAIQLMAGQNEDGTPKVSADMALAAAMYQAGTGQLLGRDFYVNDKLGRLEGYRGVARDANERGVGEVQIKYRPLTADECEEHEVKPGDVTAVCEVYQLRAWRIAQEMGQRYEPVVGVGIVRASEKTNSYGKPISLAGGMTWKKKAHNRAYKDALRHTPGMPASGDEVIEEAVLRGVEPPPAGARLTVEQAQEWVSQREGNDEPDGYTEGEYRDAPEPPTNGTSNGAGYRPEPGEEVWADWRSPNDAQAWAWSQGKFNAPKHMTNAYAKVKADCKPANARDMWRCWYEYVMAHEPVTVSADAMLDKVDMSLLAHDEDEPLFN